ILFSFSFCAYLALPALPSVPTRRSSDLNAKRTLEQNVVLRDDLPVQAAWLLEDPEFITAEGLTFQRVDELEGDDPSLSWPERARSEEHTSELQSRFDLVCRLLLEKKKTH